MIIERTPLKLKPFNLQQVEIDRYLIGQKTKRKLHLSEIQIEYLRMFLKDITIYSIAQRFLAKNVLISFTEMYKLITFLAEEDLLINSTLVQYLYKPQPPQMGLLEEIKEKLFGSEETIKVKDEVKKNPFFRTLSEPIQKVFLENTTGMIVAKNIALCREGTEQRSLFVLLRGRASVYKINANGAKEKVATLEPGSVFGETGFFLNEPRTADVVTDEECAVARIRYLPEVFDELIKKDKASHLQKRFWMIHALLKSKLFKELPSDCFDSLLFAGEFKNFSKNETIIRENEAGASCYILVQGQVRALKGQKTVRTLDQGDAFGEVALILNKGVRTATIEAITDGVLLEIPAKNFYHLMSENLLVACLFEKAALALSQNKSL